MIYLFPNLRNTFKRKIFFQADPLDAGTDNGFTFTSPNWQTVPQVKDFQNI